MLPATTPLPKHLTQAIIKHLNDQPTQEVPKKMDLVLQVLKVDDIVHNPEKKEAAKIKQK